MYGDQSGEFVCGSWRHSPPVARTFLTSPVDNTLFSRIQSASWPEPIPVTHIQTNGTADKRPFWNNTSFKWSTYFQETVWLTACLHGDGGPRVGEVTRLGGATLLSIQSLIWSPHLSCKRDQIEIKNYIDGRVTPHKRVTSPIWGPMWTGPKSQKKNWIHNNLTCTGMECGKTK